MKPIFTFPQPRRRLAEQSFHLKDRKTCPNKRSHRNRRSVLDRGCLRIHRLHQDVVDLTQTQVSGPIRYGERREIQYSKGEWYFVPIIASRIERSDATKTFITSKTFTVA